MSNGWKGFGKGYKVTNVLHSAELPCLARLLEIELGIDCPSKGEDCVYMSV